MPPETSMVRSVASALSAWMSQRNCATAAMAKSLQLQDANNVLKIRIQALESIEAATENFEFLKAKKKGVGGMLKK